jgi:hypothetical protein
MKEFESREAAFASQNYDPNAVEMKGVPAHIVEAAKGFINACVGHDAVNEGFHPDYKNYSQDKWESYHNMGSPSGAGFSLRDHGLGGSSSFVGARLVSENRKAADHVNKLFEPDYKAMKVYDRAAYEASKKK